MIDYEVRNEMFKDIVANPKDWDLYLILADWLEERNFDEYYVWRWMGKRKKTPQYVDWITPYVKGWSWFNGLSSVALPDKDIEVYSILPVVLFEIMEAEISKNTQKGGYTYDKYLNCSPTFEKAVVALHHSLISIRDVIEA